MATNLLTQCLVGALALKLDQALAKDDADSPLSIADWDEGVREDGGLILRLARGSSIWASTEDDNDWNMDALREHMSREWS